MSSIETRADRVLHQSRTLADKVGTWADFSNAVFGPSGLVARAFPSDMERQVFFDSPQHKQVNELLVGLMKKFGVGRGADPKGKSGKFVVRVPKTVHQKLDIEAKLEGVSLNQLAVTKLSLPLPRATGLMRDVVTQAFNDTHDGYSPDWAVIDPKHNALFLECCHGLGLSDPPYTDFLLNHTLMNMRKTSKYQGRLNPSRRKTGFKSYDDCSYAAEIAVRTLQRTEGVSLDRTLCDPEMRARFDALARKLAPDQTVIKLRSAAYHLRKTHRLTSDGLTGKGFDLVDAGPVKQVAGGAIADMPGTYVFYDQNRPLFAGESDNLSRRIDLHLNGGLPEWLGATEDEAVILKFAVQPDVTRDDRVKWVSGFINRERPLLNYQAAA